MMLRTVLSVARAAMFSYVLMNDRPAGLVIVAWVIGFVMISAKADSLYFQDGFDRCEKVCRAALGMPDD